jgi:hypothetical protein
MKQNIIQTCSAYSFYRLETLHNWHKGILVIGTRLSIISAHFFQASGNNIMIKNLLGKLTFVQHSMESCHLKKKKTDGS